MECHRPFTVNHSNYSNLIREFRKDLEDRHNGQERSNGNVSVTYTVKDNSGNSKTVSSRIVNGDRSPMSAAYFPKMPSVSDLASSSDFSKYKDEMELMSQVLAYHVISSERISDVVPMIFETAFTCSFSNTLREVLTSRLKLVGDSGLENCAKYAQDEPEIERNRADCSIQLGILSDALKILHMFLNSK